MGTPYIGAILDFLADDYTIPRLTLKESDWLESILRQLNIFYKVKYIQKGEYYSSKSGDDKRYRLYIDFINDENKNEILALPSFSKTHFKGLELLECYTPKELDCKVVII